jgi:hypothetical protein
MLNEFTDLYSSDVRTRVNAAAQYTVSASGADLPAAFRASWLKTLGGRDARSGRAWPSELIAACAAGTWPKHAFGTANAALLVLWHRPGVAAPGSQIEPETPTLGGVAHAHVERFVPDYLSRDRSWDLLHEYVGRGLAAFGIAHPWAAVMVACLNPEPGPTGTVDVAANRAALSAGGRLDQICAATRPLLVLACGNPVRDAILSQRWQPPSGSTLINVDHPTAWDGYGSGRREGRDVVLPLLTMWAETGTLVRPTATAPAGITRYVDPARRRPA